MWKINLRITSVTLLVLLMVALAGCKSIDNNSSSNENKEHVVSGSEKVETILDNKDANNLIDNKETEQGEDIQREDQNRPENTETDKTLSPIGKVEIHKEQLPKKYTITEVGQINDPDGDLGFRSDNVLVKRQYGENNTIADYLLTYMGEEIVGGPFSDIKALGNGVFTVTSMNNDVNNSGIATIEGEILLPCEAAIIKKLTNYDIDNDSERYLLVTYATGEVQNKNEAFFYISNSMFSFGGASEGDKLYSGYAMIYDLQNKRFVENVIVTNPELNAARHCGDYFAVKETDGTISVYDYNGNKTLTFDNPSSVRYGYNYIIVSNGSEQLIYSCAGDLLYKSQNQINVIKGSGLFVCEPKRDYSTNSVELSIMDYYGNKLFSLDKPTSFYGEHGGVFCIEQDGVYSLLHNDGSVFYSRDGMEHPSYRGNGIWIYSAKRENEEMYGIILPDGRSYETNHLILDLVSKYETGDGITESKGYKLFVLNDADYSLGVKASWISTLSDALVCSQENKRYSAYELFSGSQILPPEYKMITFASGYVYALDNETWHVFSLEVEY